MHSGRFSIPSMGNSSYLPPPKQGGLPCKFPSRNEHQLNTLQVGCHFTNPKFRFSRGAKRGHEVLGNDVLSSFLGAAPKRGGMPLAMTAVPQGLGLLQESGMTAKAPTPISAQGIFS